MSALDKFLADCVNDAVDLRVATTLNGFAAGFTVASSAFSDLRETLPELTQAELMETVRVLTELGQDLAATLRDVIAALAPKVTP